MILDLRAPAIQSVRPARRVWSLVRRFRPEYRAFFAAAFCMDFGFGLFFFLLNLYLTDLHFDDQVSDTARPGPEWTAQETIE